MHSRMFDFPLAFGSDQNSQRLKRERNIAQTKNVTDMNSV